MQVSGLVENPYACLFLPPRLPAAIELHCLCLTDGPLDSGLNSRGGHVCDKKNGENAAAMEMSRLYWIGLCLF